MVVKVWSVLLKTTPVLVVRAVYFYLVLGKGQK